MKRLTITIAHVLLALVGGAGASSQIPGAPQSGPIALMGGTVHTVSGDVLVGAAVLFDAGIITAVGTELDIPAEAERIDVTGRHVYPGMIDGGGILGLSEISSVRAGNDYDEVGEITPEARAETAVNPDSEHLPVARANGITTALSTPVGGLVPGMAALLHLDGWTTEDLVVQAPAALTVNWPRMHLDRRPSASTADQQQRRDDQIEALRQAFADARAWRKAYDAAPDVTPIDLRAQVLQPVLDGTVPVLVIVDDVRQVHAALDWADAEQVRLIIGGSGDIWRAADELAERDIPVVYWNTYYLPRRADDPYDEAYSVPAKLHAAGVRFCLGHTGRPSFTRYLPEEAGRAVAYGLPPNAALRAVTLDAADIFGIDDRLGSIEVGKEATLVVTDGDLLELTTTVQLEFIRGRRVDLSSRHTVLYDKYRTKYRRLGFTFEEGQ